MIFTSFGQQNVDGGGLTAKRDCLYVREFQSSNLSLRNTVGEEDFIYALDRYYL
jgi:hypothetical protein